MGVPFDPGFFAWTSPNQWAHSSSYNHVPTSYEAFDLQYYIGGMYFMITMVNEIV